VGPRAVLDAVVKRKIPNPRRKSNPRIIIVVVVVVVVIIIIIINARGYIKEPVSP
jgi:preprotein translocase subunit SecE